MITGPKKELLDLIKHHGQISIDDSVERIDLTKTTVREHFTQLERDGYIVRQYERSGRGRPSLHFKLSKKGSSLYPSNEPLLVKELIRFLQSNGHEDLLESFFEKFWDQRYRKLQLMLEMEGVQSEEEKVEVVRRMLDEEGFMPEYEMNADQLTMKECNCPFREVVKVTKLPCKLEKEFYEKIFDKDVERTAYIPDGDYSCTYCIK